MALRAFSVFFSAWLARAQGARVGQEEELPWKRAVAVGTILGSQVPANTVFALQDNDVGSKANTVDAVQEKDAGSSFNFVSEHTNDVISETGRSLVAFLREYQLEDGKVVENLMRSLRRSELLDDGVLELLDATVRGSSGQAPRVAIASVEEDSEEAAIQQFFFPVGKGDAGVVVIRYLKHYHDLNIEPSVQDMSRGLELSGTLEHGLFLRCLALSHSARELARDPNSEFMVMLEPTVGSLYEVLDKTPMDYMHRMQLFVELLELVQRLHELGVPHGSEISPQTIFVKGDTSDLDSLAPRLSPDLVTPSSTVSAIDRLDADIRQLGKILRWMFHIGWPGSMRQVNEVVLALGKAMEAGAFSGGPAAAKEPISRHIEEFQAVMDLVVSEQASSDDLIAARMKYLQLAIGAAKHAHEGPEEAKAPVQEVAVD